MRIVAWLVSFLADEYLTAMRRINCARHGHVLVPMTDATVCTLCGIWIED